MIFLHLYVRQVLWPKILVFSQSRYRKFPGVCGWRAILAGFSSSFAPCPVSAIAGHYDDEGVIYLRQRVVNVMQSGGRVVSHKREVSFTIPEAVIGRRDK